MKARSSRPEVRNPVLALAAEAGFAELDPAAREALRAFLVALSKDTRRKAQECWDNHKAPMAGYWKTTSVNARHTALAIRKLSHG